MFRVQYNGSGVDLFGWWILWSIVCLFTLGLAIPFAVNALFIYLSKNITLEQVDPPKSSRKA